MQSGSGPEAGGDDAFKDPKGGRCRLRRVRKPRERAQDENAGWPGALVGGTCAI